MSTLKIPAIPPQTLETEPVSFGYRGHRVEVKLMIEITDDEGMLLWYRYVMDGDQSTDLRFYLSDAEADQYYSLEQGIILRGDKPTEGFHALVTTMFDRYLEAKVH